MLNAFRWLFGLQAYEQQAGDDSEKLTSQTQDLCSRLPYNGCSVPLDASCDPDDSDWYDSWFEKFPIVPAKDGESVIVFSHWFESQDTRTNEVIYHEWAFDARSAEETNWIARLDCTNKIYQHMSASGETCKRIVQYYGPTPAGYKLERLLPGPVYAGHLRPEQSDAVLALYQRWALQTLSALEFIHGKGVVLNALTEDALWLRSDLSIAIAGFVAASCDELEIRAGHWGSMAMESYCNPWSEQNSIKAAYQKAYRSAQNDEERESIASEPIYGSDPKRDLFDWAVWLCQTMTGKSPLEHGLTSTQQQLAFSPGLMSHTKAVKYGQFDDWPSLLDEQLGAVIVKALRGEYATAGIALEDARETLLACGRTLSTSVSDEIEGFEWEKELIVEQGDFGMAELRLRKQE